MGSFIPAAIKFFGSVFLGTGLAGAKAGYILAVNLARVASLAVIAKLTQPKLDLSDLAAQKTLTIRDTIAPQTFIYGEDLISGPLLFANTTGVDDKELVMVVAHAGHEIDSVQRYRIDDKWIELSELDGAEDGLATSGDFLDVLEIELSKGTSTQSVQALLTREFGASPELFNTAHTGRGWCFTSWWFAIIEGKEDVWQNQPQNLRALIRGYKVYDPRLDSTNGGSGSHRLATPSTWEWSNNPALCLAHFLMDDKFGMSEESDRIDWPMVITAANVCDALVDIPTPPAGNQQARYTCNATFEATQDRRQVRDELVQSMLGRLVFSQGEWKMWAGATVTSDVTLTEANMAGPLSIQTVKGIEDRYNRLRGKYIDATEKDYTAASYPEARSTAYVTQDNNEIMVETADFMSTNNFYEAQRKSVFLLRQSRNQRVLSFTGNMSCFRLQAGSVVTLDIDELGFASEKFFITEWKLNPEGTIELTLVEEDDGVWTDLLRAEYATRSRTGVLTFTDTGVSPPTSLTATAFFGGVDLTWTNPAQSTFDHIEIWRSLDNDRTNAILIDTTAGNSYRDQKGDALKTRYYWVRAVDVLGRVSAFEPDLTTTTAFADPYVPQGDLVADPFIRQGATAWDVSDSNVQYRTGEGTGGTDAISAQVTNVDPFTVFYAAARRGPGTWDVLSPGTIALTINFRIALRTKPAASIWSHTPIAVVRVSDENPASNPLTYVSGAAGTNHLFTQADSINVWYDESVTLEITDSGTPPRYIQIGIWFITNPAEPEYKVDFLDAVMITPSFKGDNSTGLVPKYAGATATDDFLRADGTWATPSVAGGGLPTGTTDNATLRYDTTAGAWQESTELRSASNGNVTIGADTGGSLSITDSGGTSPTTIVPAGAGGTATLEIGLADSLSIGGSSIDHLDIANSATLRMVERSAAPADLGGHGQFWVRNDAPNTPMFTADDGTDYVLNAATEGTTTDSILRWDGSNWAELTSITAQVGGVFTTVRNVTGEISVSSNAPFVGLSDEGAPTDQKGWRIHVDGGFDFTMDTRSDGGSQGDIFLQAVRGSGNLVGDVSLFGRDLRLSAGNTVQIDDVALRFNAPSTQATSPVNLMTFWDAGNNLAWQIGMSAGNVTNPDRLQFYDSRGTSPQVFFEFESDSGGGTHTKVRDGTFELQLDGDEDHYAALQVTSTTAANGRLSVSGVGNVDKFELSGMSLYFIEQVSAHEDITSRGQLFVNTSQQLIFRTEGGVETNLLAGGVSTTGTPANDQIAVFTNSNTIEGDAELKWTGSALVIGSTISANETRFLRADTELQIQSTPQVRLTNSNAILHMGLGGKVECREFGPGTNQIDIYADATSPVIEYFNSDLRIKQNGITDYLIITNTNTQQSLGCPSGNNIRLEAGGTPGVYVSASSVTLYYAGTSNITTQSATATGNTSGATVRAHDNTMRDIGFNTLDLESQNVSVTLAAQHCGALIYFNDGVAGRTVSTPASTSADFPTYGVCTIINHSDTTRSILTGSGATNIWLDGTSGSKTGTRTLARGMAVIWKISSSAYFIWGIGIS